MMIGQVMQRVKNYFTAEEDKHSGTFRIVDGQPDVDFLLPSQYYRIIGSTFSSGVWQYMETELPDEEFSGEIWAMKVPPSFLALVGEIEAWQEKYGEVSTSPYSSESFGGYSYQKSQAEGVHAVGWESAFRAKLSRWRKL